MGAAALIGGGVLVASGNAEQAAGARQARQAMSHVYENEKDAQDQADAENQKRMQQLLDSESADSRVNETAQLTKGEADPTQAVADTVTAAAKAGAGAAPDAIRGQITAGAQGTQARAGGMAQRLARIRAQQLQVQEAQNRGRQYTLDRNRIAMRAAGRARLLPQALEVAGLKGSELKTGGATSSALGQMLLMYGMNQPAQAATPTQPAIGAGSAAGQAAAQAPLTGWAADNPYLG